MRSVVVKAAPAPTFDVVQAEVLPEVLTVALDTLVARGHEHQRPQACVLGALRRAQRSLVNWTDPLCGLNICCPSQPMLHKAARKAAELP